MAIHVNENGNIKDLVGIENNVSFFERVLTLNFTGPQTTVDYTPVYLNKSLENYTGFMRIVGDNGISVSDPSPEESIVSIKQTLGCTWSAPTINDEKCRCMFSGANGHSGYLSMYMPEDLTKNYLYYKYGNTSGWHFILYAF